MPKCCLYLSDSQHGFPYHWCGIPCLSCQQWFPSSCDMGLQLQLSTDTSEVHVFSRFVFWYFQLVNYTHVRFGKKEKGQ